MHRPEQMLRFILEEKKFQVRVRTHPHGLTYGAISSMAGASGHAFLRVCAPRAPSITHACHLKGVRGSVPGSWWRLQDEGHDFSELKNSVRSLATSRVLKRSRLVRRSRPRRAFLVWLDSLLPIVLPTQRIRRCAPLPRTGPRHPRMHPYEKCTT